MSDYFNLQQKLVRVQQKGVSVLDEVVCGACHRKIIEKDPSRMTNILLFNCKHAFHEQCMPEGSGTCGICYPLKKRPS